MCRVSTLVLLTCLGPAVVPPVFGRPGAAQAQPAVPATARSAAAAEQPRFAVQAQRAQTSSEIARGYFTLTLRPGANSVVRVMVRNDGTSILSLLDYAEDAIPITMGGVGFAIRGAHRVQVGTWITLNTAAVVILPGGSRNVTATVHVPKGLAPGQYVGGLAFEVKPVQAAAPAGSATAPKKSGAPRTVTFMFDVHYRQVIAVVITVPGSQNSSVRVDGTTLEENTWGSIATVALHNTGNMLWQGTGTVSVVGPGLVIDALAFAINTLLPGATARVAVALPAAVLLQPGAYRVRVSVCGTCLTDPPATWQGSVRIGAPDPPRSTATVLRLAQRVHPTATATPKRTKR